LGLRECHRRNIFAACDFAADYAGKLTLVGIFDSLGAPSTPVIHPQLCVAAKLRFDDTEAGPKRVRFTLTDADGRDLLPPIEMPIVAPASPAEGATSVVNLVLNLGGIKFERLGEHSLDLSVNGVHAASTPLFLRPSS
jgi:hypothetical protein